MVSFESFKNTDKGVSFGVVFVERTVTVCFLKWEWTIRL